MLEQQETQQEKARQQEQQQERERKGTLIYNMLYSTIRKNKDKYEIKQEGCLLELWLNNELVGVFSFFELEDMLNKRNKSQERAIKKAKREIKKAREKAKRKAKK
jgi:hypothetical protein